MCASSIQAQLDRSKTRTILLVSTMRSPLRFDVTLRTRSTRRVREKPTFQTGGQIDQLFDLIREIEWSG
jgi:hypothetical protein